MVEWWNALGTFCQVLFIISCASTLVLIFQFIMLLVGFGGGSDVDTDCDCGDADCDLGINDDGFVDIFGLKLFTLRNIIVFIAIGSWTMLVMYQLTYNYWWTVIVGIVAGLVMALLCAYAMKKAMLLQNDGTLVVENAKGKTGTCYLTIPAQRSGKGKVNVLVQEKLIELDAITDDSEPIKTGSQIYVIEANDSFVLVTAGKKDE